ncbi:MAG: DNA gyrase inhibitor YacG [Blastocatellia bacterium]|nr:DNA gyrase inhibitor YacG [Blastocatellia bacterium]
MRCPICKRETSWKDNPNRPFCSERCQMIDLGNWADGEYRIENSQKSEDSPVDLSKQDEREDFLN